MSFWNNPHHLSASSLLQHLILAGTWRRLEDGLCSLAEMTTVEGCHEVRNPYTPPKHEINGNILQISQSNASSEWHSWNYRPRITESIQFWEGETEDKLSFLSLKGATSHLSFLYTPFTSHEKIPKAFHGKLPLIQGVHLIKQHQNSRYTTY